MKVFYTKNSKGYSISRCVYKRFTLAGSYMCEQCKDFESKTEKFVVCNSNGRLHGITKPWGI